MKSSALVLAIAALLALGGSVRAETVMLTDGSRIGLGWLFLDFDGTCRIATPRHVLRRDDGALAAPDMIERTGRRSATSRPVAPPDETIDLAFLEASPTVSADGCSLSRLSNQSLDHLLARMQDGILSIATPVDQQAIRVERVAAARDEYGGAVLAIAPVAGAENLKEGMSGGVVFSEGRPLAMLYYVEEGIGLAYRFDAIAAAKMAALGTGTPEVEPIEAALIHDMVLTAGRVAAGAIGDLLDGTGAAELVAEDRRVILSVSLAGIRTIAGLAIEAPSGRALGTDRVIVEVGGAAGPLTYLLSCRGKTGSASLACPFAPRSVARLRLTFVEAADPQPIALGQIRIEARE
ncbi:hypothetical protein [Rhodospirillaceae bacterium SYSU D60014]|uniref:hypothetical protein n=1 Tax=Virgifigura deserti TaxID=2268457 RepID=UPI000E66AD5F